MHNALAHVIDGKFSDIKFGTVFIECGYLQARDVIFDACHPFFTLACHRRDIMVRGGDVC